MFYFRVNKIDMDLRRKLSEENDSKKIHSKQEISIDNKMKKPFVEDQQYKQQKKKKKQITVECTKSIEDEEKKELEKKIEGNMSVPGMFIDEKK